MATQVNYSELSEEAKKMYDNYKDRRYEWSVASIINLEDYFYNTTGFCFSDVVED